MDQIMYQIFKIVIKKHKALTANPPIITYANKIENRITFKIKTGKTMKFLDSTKSKIIKDENGENKLHLEIIEVFLYILILSTTLST